MSMDMDILNWFATGRVGMSSKAMAVCLSGIEVKDTSHPYDPDDFNRCLLFLEAVPLARQYMHRIAKLSPQWAALVARWDEIEKCFLEEVGLDWTKGGRAKKTYALMQEVLGRK